MPTKNEKLAKKYVIKDFDVKVEDVDVGQRMVKGYLSAFGVKDSDDDIIEPGAFSQSIRMRGPEATGNRRIAFLRQHDWDKQIGVFTELKEDDYGLLFVAKLGTSTLGEDALRDYDEGILREHSIGFRYVGGDKLQYDEEKEAWMVKEVILMEGSGVTFGANPFTHVVDVQKAEGTESVLEQLAKDEERILKSIKSCKDNDQRLYCLEQKLALHFEKYKSVFLHSSQPTLKDIVTEKIKTDKIVKSGNPNFIKFMSNF